MVSHCSAKGNDGYIITNELDTIHGTIKIKKVDQYSGAYLIMGFDLESYHSRVVFKEDGNSRYQRYEPKDISAYGFEFDGTTYIFQSFEIKKESIFNKGNACHRFLQLVHKGELSLYRDVEEIQLYHYSNYPITSDIYYLNGNSIGLNELRATAEIQTLKALLATYHVDPEFLNTISPKTKYKEIRKLLIAYDMWLNDKKLNTRQV